jgi:cardiolipin synthase
MATISSDRTADTAKPGTGKTGGAPGRQKLKKRPFFGARTVEVTYWSVFFYLLILFGLALLLWSRGRERSSHVRVPALTDFRQGLPSIANLTGSPILAGNRAEVLQNGDQFFPALFRDIAAARKSVHIETYVWWKGEICRQLASLLEEKAHQGVEVRLTLDAVGSNKGDNKLFRQMQKAGCKISYFHPFRLGDLGLVNNRTHRKLAVIDGRIGYVFGHGMAEEWTGHGQDAKHWRDTGVRVEGPVVNAVQGVFAENWVDQTSEVIAGEKYFPILPAAGSVRAHVTASAPQGGVSKMELLLKLAIASAKKELLIQNPYFIPDEELVDLLEGAVQRGVAVHIMLPGPVTDSGIVRHAGHRHFEELLAHGIHLYEYQQTLTHQKVMVVDGEWSQVGSTNLDDRSLDINDEASIGLIDTGVAATLRQAFQDDLAHCRELDLASWRKRGLWHRLLDQASYAINEEL